MRKKETDDEINIFHKHVAKAIADKIKEIRKSHLLTQREFAVRVGLSRVSVSNIENGKHRVGLRLLIRIADAMEREISDFIPTWKTIRSVKRQSEKHKFDGTKLPTRQKQVVSSEIKSMFIGNRKYGR